MGRRRPGCFVTPASVPQRCWHRLAGPVAGRPAHRAGENHSSLCLPLKYQIIVRADREPRPRMSTKREHDL